MSAACVILNGVRASALRETLQRYRRTMVDGMRRVRMAVWKSAREEGRNLTLGLMGYDAESRRGTANLFAGVGFLCLGAFLTVESASAWLGWGGGAFLFTAFMLMRGAHGQAKREMTAADLMEWVPRQQAFRRGMDALWYRLKRAYDEDNRKDRLEDLVNAAGTPKDRGVGSGLLKNFLSKQMPPKQLWWAQTSNVFEEPVPPLDLGVRDLVREYTAVKDILEIWEVGLDLGGRRGRTVRKIIADLYPMHLTSFRLLWWLSVVHTEHVDVTDDPDYGFIERTWKVMLSEHGINVDMAAEP